jgi:hypothetical protein
MFDESVAAGYEAGVAALKAQPLFGRPEPQFEDEDLAFSL